MPDAIEVGKATALAQRLVLDAVDQDLALQRLRGVPGGLETLRRAAERTSSKRYFPTDRAHDLLREAAGGPRMPALTAEQQAMEEQQRQLITLDAGEAFQLLADRMPELIELDRRARAPASVPASSRLSGWLARKGDPRGVAISAFATLSKQAKGMVGPDSGQSDFLLASPAALNAVSRHLTNLLLIEKPPAAG